MSAHQDRSVCILKSSQMRTSKIPIHRRDGVTYYCYLVVVLGGLLLKKSELGCLKSNFIKQYHVLKLRKQAEAEVVQS